MFIDHLSPINCLLCDLLSFYMNIQILIFAYIVGERSVTQYWKFLSTHFGNDGVGIAISVWDQDMGGLLESESGVALLDLELELKLWNNGQHMSKLYYNYISKSLK